MKCPRCRRDNLAEASFCGECGARLAEACSACGASNPPTNRFCRQCGVALSTGIAMTGFASPESFTPRHLAQKILTQRKVLEGERKQVTVLFADTKSSMELLADRDPEEARTILDPVLEFMMEAVHLYEGTVNQVMGDGIMALFGAPLAHEDHAVRACYAALRIQDSARHYAEEIRRGYGASVRVRIGLNSGEVVVRSISNDLHMDYTAVGQTTHLASRMEQLADPGQILLTAKTLLLAEGYVDVTPLGPIPVKGLSAPVETYELTAAGRLRRRFEATALRGLSRFVGRDAELERLGTTLERAGLVTGQIVGIAGEPGVGKSRLVHEFVHSRGTQGWLVLQTGAVSYGRTIPYIAAKNLLREYFELEIEDSTATSREKVGGKLRALDRALEPCLSPFLTLLDVPSGDARWEAVDPPSRRQRTIDAIRQLLLRASEIRPLLLVFEDLHWIDSETQAVLDSLVEVLPRARILLLTNYRPEYEHSWGTRPHYTEMRIDPLLPESAEELLDSLLGSDPALEELKQLLIARTEGNPFFLEECVRTLLETQVLAGERGAYRVTGPIKGAIVPSTVKAVLAARIDRLVEDDRHLLQSAAVIGKDVPFVLLNAIADMPEDELRRKLTRLQRAEFLYEIRPSPDVLEYTFKHALTYEVAYQSLLSTRRRVLHARITDAIETLYADRVADHIEQLAHHALCGEQFDRAVKYAREAGTKALARSAYRNSVEHFDQALAALAHLPAGPTTSQTAIDLHFDLRTALTPLGEHGRIIEHLREAEGLAQTLGDDVRLARVSAYLADYFRQVGEHDRAISAGERALAIAHRLDDPTLEIASNTYLGHACQNTGQYRRAITLFQRNANLASGDLVRDTFGLPFPSSVQSRIWLAACLNELGEFSAGIEAAEESIRIAEMIDHAASLATACSVLGNLYLRMGEPSQALPFLERGYELSRTRNLNIWMPNAESWLGLAQVRLGRLKEGLRLLQSAVDRDRSMARLAHHSIRLAALAEGYLRLGQVPSAASTSAQALDLSVKQGERGNEAHALHGLAEIAARSNPPALDEAEAAFRRGLDLAEELEMRPVAARCHLGLATLLRETDRTDEGRRHLDEALILFHAMGVRAPDAPGEAERARLS